MSYPRLFRILSPRGTGRRQKRTPWRPLRCELLETRRLLVAEGDVFAFTDTLDAAGLVGNVSAAIRWGDGVTTPATSVSGGNQTGNLAIRFDYSLDTNNFFRGANQFRQNLLQIAADSLINRFSDDLAAITPSSLNQWEVSVFHPSMGAVNELEGTITPLAANPQVAANEIILYVGARDLPGNTRGVGGPAARSVTRLPPVNCPTQAECDRITAEFEAFQEIVNGRGEAGALASPPTDVAPHIGSISFDNNTDFYFNQPGGIQPGQVDFTSVATHEIAHVLGFGTSDSWNRLVQTGVYTGPQANAQYVGNGSVPVAPAHWAQSVAEEQSTLMAPSLNLGVQQLFSPLDFAAMDDIGWDVVSTQTTVSGEHRYADNGSFVPEVVLSGDTAGELVFPLSNVSVTNVNPTLVVPDTQNVNSGETLTITDIGVITDPGSRNTSIDPATAETFTYKITWGDGSPPDQGMATIDAHGDRNGALTKSSFDGAHVYQTAGMRQVTASVRDDDGGIAERTFSVIVTDSPAPTIKVVASPTGPGGTPDPADLPKGPQPASWAGQRSDLRVIVITLITPISTVSANDIVLTNLGVNAAVDTDVVVPLNDDQLSLSVDGIQLTISFAAAQLSDGVYKLQLLSAITGGDTFTFTGNALNKFFVLRGDWNGSGGVNIQDFATFTYWFGTSQAPQYVDLNASGGVNIQDFAGFAGNFGASVSFSEAAGEFLPASPVPAAGLQSLSGGVNQQVANRDGPVNSPDALIVLKELPPVVSPTPVAMDRREIEPEETWPARRSDLRRTAGANRVSRERALTPLAAARDVRRIEKKSLPLDDVIRLLAHDRAR